MSLESPATTPLLNVRCKTRGKLGVWVSFAAWSAARSAAASVLLVAMGLKAWSLTHGDLSDLAKLRVILQVLLEAGLAIWLIFPQPKLWCWLAVGVCFSAFTGWNTWAILQGKASCGCLGEVIASPWSLVVVDGVILLLLMAAMPTAFLRKELKMPRIPQILGVIAGLILTALFAANVWSQVATTQPTTAESERPVIEDGRVFQVPLAAENTQATVSPRIDLGYVEPSSKHRITLELVNPSAQPIQLTSIESECKCAQVKEAPEQLAPNASVQAHLIFDAWEHRSDYLKHVTFYVAGPKTRWKIEAVVTARIGLPLAIEPSVVDLDGSGQPQSVTVRNDGQEPVKILYGLSQPVGCRVTVPPDLIMPRATATLTILPPQSISDNPSEAATYLLTLRTTSTIQPSLTLNVRKRDGVK